MAEQSALHHITRLSHEFGTPDYVKGGGGNTSVKDGSTLWIKPSGTTLSGLTPDTFVPIDRGRLTDVYAMEVPDDAAEREERVKNLMQAAVLDASKGRPSVETPLHDMLDAQFVVHTHPVLVNGMTCARDGARTAARLFPDALWIPYTDPGFILSMDVKRQVEAYRAEHGHEPAVILWENHGVFVSGDTPDDVRERYRSLISVLAQEYRAAGIACVLPEENSPPHPERIRDELRAVLGEDAEGFASHAPVDVAEGPLTPDHMVYAKAYPYPDALTEAGIEAFVQQHGYKPRIVLTEDGVYAVGVTQAKAQLALDLALDGALVRQLTRAFGGVQYLDDAAREFIENWEVESYRESMASTKRT